MNRRHQPLVVVETHPVQYHAPVYRAVQQTHGVPVEVIYGSDFSVAGFHDAEFNASFAWDVDLTSGNRVTFLSQVCTGGARSVEEIRHCGIGEALDRAGPAAVLVTGYQSSFCFAALYEAWRRRLPILFRAETTDHATRRNLFRGLGRDLALRCLYSRCGRVLPIGSHSRRHYTRLGVPERKMILSPYCVDTAPFECWEADRQKLRPGARRELDLGAEDIAILFSGKLSRRKGVHLLAESVKWLPEGLRKRIALLFLGAGREEGALRAACGEVPVRARFIGFRNQTQLSPYYHAADMLVLPSLEGETWGLVVNEALHHGLPCVVSDAVGCAPDLIEEGSTGEIARAGSCRNLASALERSVSLIGASLTRSRCRAKVGPFTVDNAAEGVARAYRDVTESGECPLPVAAKSLR
jgi:glycosyltransferase involved in cell wall biosynthesis